MKTFHQSLWATALAVFSLAAAGNVSAQGKLDDINVITVALKIQLQSPGFNSQNGATRTYAKPVVQTINTKNLLDRLALDKQAQGLYANNTFPGGAKLALSSNQVVVVKSNNDFIVDVSDIVSFTAGNNDVLSGTIDNTTSLARPNITELIIVSFSFDDTFIVGGSDLSFSVQGLDSVKTSDSIPNSNSGKYSEKTSDKVSDGTGEGQSGGTPFVITGSINGNLNASLTYAPAPPAPVE